LADYFKSAAAPAENPNFDKLLDLIEKDLKQGISNANAIASDVKDRGALRALVWSEKVTRILKSLLTRYKKEGESMLANTGVYVCTICGFVYIGDKLPEVCPVCKVPSWKFEKVEGR
jgi:rubrerythrin